MDTKKRVSIDLKEKVMPSYNKVFGRGVYTVLMESILGRKLKKTEVAHHINTIRNDNRPENLRVMSRSDHTSFHRRQKRKAAL